MSLCYIKIETGRLWDNEQGLRHTVYALQLNKVECGYYSKEFNTVGELIDDVMSSGMDPNYYITKNGVNIGEMVSDYIVY
jgi:hypothetical protein